LQLRHASLLPHCRPLCKYPCRLIPFSPISRNYWPTSGGLNLFAAFYLICRKLFLKDTGEKLAHLEKQLRSGGTISEELSRRLKEY